MAAEALHVSLSGGDGSLLRLGDVEIEARRNPDRGPESPDAPFLTWPSLIEIEAPQHVTEAELVNVVGSLLTALWSKNVRAVAAADFEERLPCRGGWHAGKFIEA
jgi:hypothetical protein